LGDEPEPYSKGERAAGIFGAVLFVALALIAADLASGGRLFRRAGGCTGCGEEAAGDGGS
jgi:hypothetical protein